MPPRQQFPKFPKTFIELLGFVFWLMTGTGGVVKRWGTTLRFGVLACFLATPVVVAVVVLFTKQDNIAAAVPWRIVLMWLVVFLGPAGGVGLAFRVVRRRSQPSTHEEARCPDTEDDAAECSCPRRLDRVPAATEDGPAGDG